MSLRCFIVGAKTLVLFTTVAFIRWQVLAWKCGKAECHFRIPLDGMRHTCSKLQRQKWTVLDLLHAPFLSNSEPLLCGGDGYQLTAVSRLKKLLIKLCGFTLWLHSVIDVNLLDFHIRRKAHQVEICSRHGFWHEESAEEKTMRFNTYCAILFLLTVSKKVNIHSLSRWRSHWVKLFPLLKVSHSLVDCGAIGKYFPV